MSAHDSSSHSPNSPPRLSACAWPPWLPILGVKPLPRYLPCSAINDRRIPARTRKPCRSSADTDHGNPTYRCMWGAPDVWNSTHQIPIGGPPNFRSQRRRNLSRERANTSAFGMSSSHVDPGTVNVIKTSRSPISSHGRHAILNRMLPLAVDRSITFSGSATVLRTRRPVPAARSTSRRRTCSETPSPDPTRNVRIAANPYWTKYRLASRRPTAGPPLPQSRRSYRPAGRSTVAGGRPRPTRPSARPPSLRRVFRSTSSYSQHCE
jgi:hypothetical protein